MPGDHYLNLTETPIDRPQVRTDLTPFFESRCKRAACLGAGNQVSIRPTITNSCDHVKVTTFTSVTDEDRKAGYTDDGPQDMYDFIQEKVRPSIPEEIQPDVNQWVHTSNLTLPEFIESFVATVEAMFPEDGTSHEGPFDMHTVLLCIMKMLQRLPVKKSPTGEVFLVTTAPEPLDTVSPVSLGDKASGISPILGKLLKTRADGVHAFAKTLGFMEAALNEGIMGPFSLESKIAVKSSVEKRNKKLRVFQISDSISGRIGDTLVGTQVKASYATGLKSLNGLSAENGGVAHLPLLWAAPLADHHGRTNDEQMLSMREDYAIEIDMTAYDLKVPQWGLALGCWFLNCTVGDVLTNETFMTKGHDIIRNIFFCSAIRHQWRQGKMIVESSGTPSGHKLTTFLNTTFNTSASGVTAVLIQHDCPGADCYCRRIPNYPSDYVFSDEMKLRADMCSHLGDDCIQLGTTKEETEMFAQAAIAVRTHLFGMEVKCKIGKLFTIPLDNGRAPDDAVRILQKSFRMDLNKAGKPIVSAYRDVARPLGKLLESTRVATKLLVNTTMTAYDVGCNPGGHAILRKVHEDLSAEYRARELTSEYAPLETLADLERVITNMPEITAFPSYEAVQELNTPTSVSHAKLLFEHYISQKCNMSYDVLSMSSY